MPQHNATNHADQLIDTPFYPMAQSENLLGNLDNSLTSETDSFEKRSSEKDESRIMDYDQQNPFAPVETPNIKGKSSQTFLPHRLSTKSIPGLGSSNQISEATMDGAWMAAKFAGRYAMKILINTLRYLQQPLSLVLCFYLLTFMAGYISQSLYRAFSPICMFPGFSNFSICHDVCRVSDCPSPRHVEVSGNSIPSKPTGFSALMDVQSASFEQLLQELAGGSGLSLQIKKAEMAVTDLAVRIRASDLKATDSLARSLSEFVFDAKKTARGLQRLTSKVGGAVDNIMAVNEYALQAIESARSKQLRHWLLNFSLPWTIPSRQTEEIVSQTFNYAINVLSINMGRLILEAEHSLYNLNDLEEQLITLHQIVSREDSSISSAKSSLLEDIWTRMGGNRKSLTHFDSHLALLRGLGTYRQQALTHVVSALQTLRAMSEDMEDLRERVAAPELVGGIVPVEVYIKSIQTGLDRMREGRFKAKILE